MIKLAEPITPAQLLDLVRKLSPADRRSFVDCLLAERFDAVMAEADQSRGTRPGLTDEEIQAEIDAVREQNRQGRLRADGG